MYTSSPVSSSVFGGLLISFSHMTHQRTPIASASLSISLTGELTYIILLAVQRHSYPNLGLAGDILADDTQRVSTPRHAGKI